MDPVGFIEVLISFYLSSLDCITRTWKGAKEVSGIKISLHFRELKEFTPWFPMQILGKIFLHPNRIHENWHIYLTWVVNFQENYNTPAKHTPGNPLANYERNPFIACW